MGREADGDFDEVGRELRERMSGEFRLAAEEDEYWAMKQARRSGTLAEIAYDAMSRGDLVEIRIGEMVYRGHVRHARNDLLVLQGTGYLDVNLAGPVLLRVVEKAASAGVGMSPRGAESFTARLAELEQSKELCRFVCVSTEVAVEGRVSIRARDHLIVEDSDGGEWVLPLPWIVAVVHANPLPYRNR